MVAEMIEDYDWESDESEDWESDEAFAESEDSAEDIGEARRRRRQRGLRPVRGRQGLTVRRPGGGVQRVPFPAPLATAAETNRGLAKLAERLNRLETRSRVQQNKDGAVTGMVTLAIGGGLAGFGAIQSRKSTVSGTAIQKWVAEPSTRTAALVSATQLATSGAKVVIKGRYDKSAIGVTADVFAAALLAAFAFGSLKETRKFKIVANRAAALAAMKIDDRGTVYLTHDESELLQLEIDAANNRALRLVS